MNTLVLAAIGGIIILGLGGYAAHLLLKLRKQNQLVEQHKALAIEKRNAKIFESVDTLCLAGIQVSATYQRSAFVFATSWIMFRVSSVSM